MSSAEANPDSNILIAESRYGSGGDRERVEPPLADDHDRVRGRCRAGLVEQVAFAVGDGAGRVDVLGA
jgi:hypothetical protein